MKVLSATDFRLKMKKHLDMVSEDKDLIVIRRPSGHDDVILLSSQRWNMFQEILKEWNGWKETIHLLESAANNEWLLESIEQARSGNYTERPLAAE